MKFDTRDKIVLVIIALTLLVLVWTGFQATACVRVMNLYEESGGYGWICQSCDILADAGIVTGG